MNECVEFPKMNGVRSLILGGPFGWQRRRNPRQWWPGRGDTHMGLAGLISTQKNLRGGLFGCVFLVGGHTCSWVLGSLLEGLGGPR